MRDEEEEYLRKVKTTKPRICEPPLYKLSGKGYYQVGKKEQNGGFIGAILPLLRFAAPFIIDYGIQKFSGNGYVYRHHDKSELTDDEKRSLLLNIIVTNPHLAKKIFS